MLTRAIDARAAASDASEVTEAYRTFNRLHEEALGVHITERRYLELLDQMETVICAVARVRGSHS